jgi:predicted class III extradiol MEMO1 family dioxygenase
MVMSTREAAVSGQFYPSNPDEIESMLEHYNQILDEHLKDKDGVLHLKPRAVIVPHAGYVYSGFTANIALRLLANSNAKRVVIIGPSHRVYLNGTSISEFDTYQTPLGALPIDKVLVSDLKGRFEVKTYTPDVSVVELVYGDESPAHLAEVIEYLLKDPETAVVISTDLSHYYDIKKANTLDSICLDAVKELNPAELHQGCEACGKIGVEAMLLTAKKNSLKSILLDYRTSADASGDESQVVGYMSAAFVEQ